MTNEERKEYNKAYYQARKEERKEYKKTYYQAHKEKLKAYQTDYNKAHKEDYKAYFQAHKEERKEYKKTYYQAHKEYYKEYTKSDLNSLGETKHSIRLKSQSILNQMNLKIPGYEIHHCFGYEDPSKFIYISKSLHLKIHQFLRDNKISADTDHWMAIRDLVNSTDEFMYIKC